jgi:magnesium chelatase family protein
MSNKGDKAMIAEINKGVDLSEIIGQEHAKRAIEVASVSKANILFVGSPGAGKSMLAEAYAGLMGNTQPVKIIRVSVADTIKSLNRKLEADYSQNALIMADELPELKRDVLLYIKELSQAWNIPVVASMHPCPCGYLGDARKQCSCTPSQITRYRASVSGSLWELFDIHIEVPPVSIRDLCNNINGTVYMQETTENVLTRVIPAKERYNLHQDNLKPCEDALDLLATACQKLGFSAKAVSKILRISRAIADLDSEQVIKAQHISEAIQYRTFDRHV